MYRILIPFIGFICMVSAPPSRTADTECSAKSGVMTTALLELYTSEDCNSCPPADKWVSNLNASGFTAQQIVPLAFHVDYWNHLGWEDNFAQQRFSARQRDIAKLRNYRLIYTPQFLLNGKDFRQWRETEAITAPLKKINAEPARAEISLALQRGNNQALRVVSHIVVADPAARPHATAYIALYENNLNRDVKAGENKGLKLHHDFVVRELLGPFKIVSADGKLQLDRNIQLKADFKPADTGVAAFIQNQKTGEVLQALALNLCN